MLTTVSLLLPHSVCLALAPVSGAFLTASGWALSKLSTFLFKRTHTLYYVSVYLLIVTNQHILRSLNDVHECTCVDSGVILLISRLEIWERILWVFWFRVHHRLYIYFRCWLQCTLIRGSPGEDPL